MFGCSLNFSVVFSTTDDKIRATLKYKGHQNSSFGGFRHGSSDHDHVCADSNVSVPSCLFSCCNGPQTVEECRADKTGGQRDFLCHLAMQSVMSKHDCRLDAKYKLPKLT